MQVTSPVFDEWKGMPLDEVLGLCRDTIEEADFSPVDTESRPSGVIASL